MTDSDQEDLPPTTMPSTVGVSVQGFDNEEAARRLGHTVLSVVSTLGSFIDLSQLDGITIGIDYDAALASVDRGIPGLHPLTRSNSEEMQGVAMSPAVMRDGGVRTHLVFSAERLVPLIWEGEEIQQEDRDMSVGLIAHECAHVQVTAEKERAIPEARFGTRIEGYERAVMFQIAEICWDEYAVCRLSARFAPQQSRTHADTVVACAKVGRDQSDDAIRAYRVHGDVGRLIDEAAPPLVQPIKAAAYLLGSMDGEGVEWSDLPEVRTVLEENDYAELVDALQTELRRLWDTRDQWDDTLAVFASLEKIAKRLFDSGGLFFKTDPQGNCRIDVPFTAHTMSV